MAKKPGNKKLEVFVERAISRKLDLSREYNPVPKPQSKAKQKRPLTRQSK